MAIPTNKTELIAAIEHHYSRWQAELALVDPSTAQLPIMPGHAKDTNMSVCNLVAYLNGWGQLVLKWHAKHQAGETIDFPETGYKWNELGLLAQRFYTDHSADDLTTLSAKLDETTRSILALIHAKTNESLYGRPWYEKYTLGRMIQLNTAAPFKNARDRLRSAREAT